MALCPTFWVFTVKYAAVDATASDVGLRQHTAGELEQICCKIEETVMVPDLWAQGIPKFVTVDTQI